MNEVFEKVKCNLCGNDDADILFPSTLPQDLSLKITERFAPADHVSGNDQIVKCSHCGLMYVSPRMKRELIWQGYGEAIDQKYASQADERIATFKRALKEIEGYAPKNGSLLDVGCAAGFFLKVAKDAGWRVRGLEPNERLAEFGRKKYDLPIDSIDLLSANLEAEAFDVITFWDVLEHVTDPAGYVEKAYKLLKPGGHLFVTFPDSGSIFARIFGQKWWFISPVHLYYFTRVTLGKLFKKEGFEVVSIHRYWQTLAFGYLFQRFADYSKIISAIGVRVCKALGLADLPVRYYAGQALAIVKKPKK